MDFVNILLPVLSPLVGVGLGAYIPAYFESKRAKRALDQEQRSAQDARSRDMRVQQFERIQELMRNVTVDIGSSVDDYQEHLELTGPVWAEYLERLASSLSSKHRAVRSLYMGISDKPILEAVDKAYEDSSAWLYASADAVTNRVARPEGLVMPADALETVTWAVHDRIGELGL